MYKGSGSQALSASVPTSFAEVDAAHHPVAGASGSCISTSGITNVLLSPDTRLVGSVIHVVYVKPTSSSVGNVVYQAFDTSTDLWGSPTTLAADATVAVDSGWPRGGASVVTVDNAGAIIAVYNTATAIKYLKCTATCGTAGNWSGGTVYTGTHVAHPSIMTSADGITHLVWLNNSVSASASVVYSQYNGSSWITPETVASSVLNDSNDDQSPSVAVDSSNRPYILYLIGTVASFTDNYIRVKVRTGVNTYVDDSPQAGAGAPSSSGTLSTHTPQNYFDWNGNHFVILAHDSVRNPGPYKLQAGGYNNNYGSLIAVDPRNETNTTAGTPGVDGSATIRYDPLRNTDTGVIDFGYYDEDDGTTGNHHSTLYYKALVIDGTGSYANLWIDSDGGTCTRSATLVAYDTAKACSSFTTAYNAASAGDIIYVKAGTYAAQTVPSRSLGTTQTTIKAAPSEVVNTGSISINTNYIVVEGFNLGNNGMNIGTTFSGSTCTRTDVTIRNNTMAGVNAGITGNCSLNTLIEGNDISLTNVCNGGPEDSIQFAGNGATGTWGEITPRDITFKNNYIHDMATANTQCGAHSDGVQMAGCINCTFDGNRFNNTDTSAVIIYAPSTGSSGQLLNIVFRNNSVGNVNTGSHGFSVGGGTCIGATNFTLENNTFWTTNTHDLNCTGASSNGTARNNLYAVNDSGFSCNTGNNDLTWDRNVYVTGMTGCGTNKKNCTPSFASPTHVAGNVDLSPSDTCAKDAIPNVAGTFPATDIHGTARPQGALIDAGAFEYSSGAATTYPRTSGGGRTIGKGHSVN